MILTTKSFAVLHIALMILILLSPFVAAHPGDYRDRLEGFDFGKLDDPDENSVKYRAGRVFEHYPPDSNNFWSVTRDLRAAGLNPARAGFDEIDFNDGRGAVDVIRASGVEGGGSAWQWLVQGTPHHAPALRVISPNGGEVFNVGDTIDIRWTSRTFSSNTIPAKNFIAVQFIKSTGERFDFFSTSNDDSEQVKITSNIPTGLYKARISTTIDVPRDIGNSYAVDDLSDNLFEIRGASGPATNRNFPIGWLDGITSDGIISGWALDKDRPSDSIDVHLYFDRPAGSGTAIGVSANVFRDDVNKHEGVTGNHGFNFRVPDNLRDGSTHTVWAYGIDRDDTSGNSNRELLGSPKTFRLGGTIFVNSFEEGTNKPIVADFQILRNGQVVFANQHSSSIEYTNQPIGAYELQVFTPASSSAYEWPPRFDQSGPRTLTSNGRVGWNMFWKLKTVASNNAPAVSHCNPRSSTVNIGERVTIDYLIIEPEGDSFTVRVDWGDGETSTTSTPTEASHTYSRAGTFRVKITATDSKGAPSREAPCGPITVNVVQPQENRAPEISSCNPASPAVSLGNAAALNYAVSDPDGDAVTVTAFWRDGQTSIGSQASASHTYASTGTFNNVKIVARDSKGKEAEKSCGDITVNPAATTNNRPVISSCGPAAQTVILGNAATINYAVSDPEGDSFTVTVFWGDGTSSAGSPSSASHTYSSAGTFNFRIVARDSRGNERESNCGLITVTSPSAANEAPRISSCNPASPTTALGNPSTINYVVSDPEGDSFTVSVFWGDSTSSAGSSSSASRTYTSTGTFGPVIVARDSRGNERSSTCGSIAVTSTPAGGNTAPQISSCSVLPSSITAGNSVTATYSVSDPQGDAITNSINWGDSTTTAGGASSASKTYSSAGTFNVVLTSTDSRSAPSSFNCGQVAVSSAPGPTTPTPAAADCPKIKITDVDAKVDGKSDKNLDDNDEISKKAAPGSSVELRVTVMNLYNVSEDNDLEDIEVRGTIEGIDDEDLEDEAKEFDLRPQDDKTVTLRFELPEDVEEGDYDITIEAEGRDEKRKCSNHEDDVDLSLEVEKEEHKLRFTRLSLSKSAIDCSEPFVLSYEIANLGQEDQKNAFVEIRNDDLGLNFVQKDISIESESGNNKVSRSRTLKVSSSAADGIYPIAVNVYSDNGKLQDTETANLEVKNCAGKKPTTAEERVATHQVSTIRVTGTDTVEQVYRFPVTSEYFSGRNRNLWLLVLSTFILSVFLLFAAIVAMINAEED